MCPTDVVFLHSVHLCECRFRSRTEVFIAGFRIVVIDIASAVYAFLTVGAVSVETGYGERGSSEGDVFGCLHISSVGYFRDGVSVVCRGGTA